MIGRMSAAEPEIILRGKVFSVERVKVPLADGSVEAREIVRHPGAVCVIGELDDGRLVAIRNYRMATGRWMVEFCAGKLEPGEPPIDAARRELEEETGYSSSTIEPLGAFFTSPGFADELMYAFVARGLRPCPQRLQPDERIEVITQTVDEIAQMIRDGALIDGKSISAFCIWRLRADLRRSNR
jgi:ADP-ribose pyrophosphatase